MKAVDIDLLVSDNVVVDVNDGGDSDDSMPGLMEFDDGDDSDKEVEGNDIDVLVSDNVVVDVDDGGDSDETTLHEFGDGGDSDETTRPDMTYHCYQRRGTLHFHL